MAMNCALAQPRNAGWVSWRADETMDLLDIWGERKIQEQLRSSHRNLDTFAYVAREMAARGHRRTAVECRSKTKVLRLEYKRVITHNARSGSNRKTCPFFHQLHRILRGDASVKPKRVARSLDFPCTQPGGRGSHSSPAPHPKDMFMLGLEPMKDVQACYGENAVGCPTASIVQENQDVQNEIQEESSDIILPCKVEEDDPDFTAVTETDETMNVPQVSSEDPVDHPEPAIANPRSILSPVTRLAQLHTKKKRGERAEAMFNMFLEHAREENVQARLDHQKEKEEFLSVMKEDSAVMQQILLAIQTECTESTRDRKQYIDSMNRNYTVLTSIANSLDRLTAAMAASTVPTSTNACSCQSGDRQNGDVQTAKTQHWSRSETIALLVNVKNSEGVALLFGSSSCHNKRYWQQIQCSMCGLGYSRTEEQLMTRWKHLRKDFIMQGEAAARGLVQPENSSEFYERVKQVWIAAGQPHFHDSYVHKVHRRQLLREEHGKQQDDEYDDEEEEEEEADEEEKEEEEEEEEDVAQRVGAVQGQVMVKDQGRTQQQHQQQGNIILNKSSAHLLRTAIQDIRDLSSKFTEG